MAQNPEKLARIGVICDTMEKKARVRNTGRPKYMLPLTGPTLFVSPQTYIYLLDFKKNICSRTLRHRQNEVQVIRVAIAVVNGTKLVCPSVC